LCVCGNLGNKDLDLGHHVDPMHMFSPGLTCKLCVHVYQTDVYHDGHYEEHMQSGFFRLINHVLSTVPRVSLFSVSSCSTPIASQSSLLS
jgi:hypothetical protein